MAILADGVATMAATGTQYDTKPSLALMEMRSCELVAIDWWCNNRVQPAACREYGATRVALAAGGGGRQGGGERRGRLGCCAAL